MFRIVFSLFQLKNEVHIVFIQKIHLLIERSASKRRNDNQNIARSTTESLQGVKKVDEDWCLSNLIPAHFAVSVVGPWGRCYDYLSSFPTGH